MIQLRRLTALLDGSRDATVAVDVTGRIAEWNPAAEDLFGWARDEMLDVPIRLLVPPEEVDAFEARWGELASGSEVATSAGERLHRDGTRLPLTVHSIAVRDDHGFAGMVATFTPRTCLEATHSDLRMAAQLRVGLEAGEMRLHYQPIVELAKPNRIGVEALVRWQRPGVSLLPPVEFIGMAERTGQIVPLGAWVTRQACQVAVQLGSSHSMSVNLSARQLSSPGIVGMLEGTLHETGCDPASLIIEVTETAFLHDMRSATANLRAMKRLGVAVALDDFGTGYSTLKYLKSFPVDRIKVDRSFVVGLGHDPTDTAIVASTISLAHSMGVEVVAEGVETVDQLSLLRQLGCDFAQGYAFSPALPIELLQEWLEDPWCATRPQARDLTATPGLDLVRRLRAGGSSLHTIAAALNLEGLLTDVGLRWTASSVGRVIAQSEHPASALLRTGT